MSFFRKLFKERARGFQLSVGLRMMRVSGVSLRSDKVYEGGMNARTRGKKVICIVAKCLMSVHILNNCLSNTFRMQCKLLCNVDTIRPSGVTKHHESKQSKYNSNDKVCFHK